MLHLLAQGLPTPDFDPRDAFAIMKWVIVAQGAVILGLCYVIKKLWEYDRSERKSLWVAVGDMNLKRVERDAKIQEASTLEHTVLTRLVDRLEKVYDIIVGGAS